MTVEEYKRFYVDFVLTILNPAVAQEVSNDPVLRSNPARQAEYQNLVGGLVILALVSFVESNFLSTAQLKSLRNFAGCAPPLPSKVNLTHLSCFVYIRDCFAHDPSGQLLSGGTNTTQFLAALQSGAFPWASIAGSTVSLTGASHELHLMILRFFGQEVRPQNRPGRAGR